MRGQLPAATGLPWSANRHPLAVTDQSSSLNHQPPLVGRRLSLVLAPNVSDALCCFVLVIHEFEESQQRLACPQRHTRRGIASLDVALTPLRVHSRTRHNGQPRTDTPSCHAPDT